MPCRPLVPIPSIVLVPSRAVPVIPVPVVPVSIMAALVAPLMPCTALFAMPRMALITFMALTRMSLVPLSPLACVSLMPFSALALALAIGVVVPFLYSLRFRLPAGPRASSAAPLFDLIHTFLAVLVQETCAARGILG